MGEVYDAMLVFRVDRQLCATLLGQSDLIERETGRRPNAVFVHASKLPGLRTLCHITIHRLSEIAVDKAYLAFIDDPDLTSFPLLPLNGLTRAIYDLPKPDAGEGR